VLAANRTERAATLAGHATIHRRRIQSNHFDRSARGATACPGRPTGHGASCHTHCTPTNHVHAVQSPTLRKAPQLQPPRPLAEGHPQRNDQSGQQDPLLAELNRRRTSTRCTIHDQYHTLALDSRLGVLRTRPQPRRPAAATSTRAPRGRNCPPRTARGASHPSRARRCLRARHVATPAFQIKRRNTRWPGC
jgi:hypothetical protein